MTSPYFSRETSRLLQDKKPSKFKLTPERRSYYAARYRCNNKKYFKTHRYGGRGIKFLFDSFQSFYDCLGPKPTGYTLDRINNDGNYEAGNVRWASYKTQTRNSTTPKLTAKDVKRIKHLLRIGKPQSEIANKFGVHPTCISQILLGKIWADDLA